MAGMRRSRKVVQVGVTRNPIATWIAQQIAKRDAVR